MSLGLDHATLESASQTLARMLSRTGVTVRFSAQTKAPKANLANNQVEMPVLPETLDPETFKIINGALDHEVGHIRHSRMSDGTLPPFENGTQEHMVWNILDDGFVNRKMEESFPGSRDNLNALYDWLSERHSTLLESLDGDDVAEEDEKTRKVLTALLTASYRYVWRRPDIAEPFGVDSGEFLDQLPQELIEQYLEIKIEDDVVAAVEPTLEWLKKMLAEPEPPEESEDSDESKQDSGKGFRSVLVSDDESESSQQKESSDSENKSEGGDSSQQPEPKEQPEHSDGQSDSGGQPSTPGKSQEETSLDTRKTAVDDILNQAVEHMEELAEVTEHELQAIAKETDPSVYRADTTYDVEFHITELREKVIDIIRNPIQYGLGSNLTWASDADSREERFQCKD